MLFKQVTQSNRINLLFTLAITAIAIAAAAAAILRTLTFEASPFPLDLFIKRLLMLTTVKVLNNCIAAFAAANIAFDNFLALDAALLRSAASSPGGLANRSRSFKTFIKLNSLIVANRSPVTQSASSILPFPALALAAFIAPVAFVALIIVAPFALIVALAALTAALAVAITLAERRAKVKRLLRALIDLLL
ncbi:hypothetical protein MBM_06893 [Drepanopeziza brunnea f. sp. 'multigermtubi' MB_m1]|uniref:Uncharacterized protein n=1 Tax=Marssonina brunnea f. sp. multigermtubi (strain MB_m1) TaxID=1072389 RepID=K1WS14_MARBU|nr:uncharacterized protein MBM_06893 [Drepanopeziza brunnea f. sp. 'multigermtubi' MB_m1]EKD15132.1 hypothetical protein MBM_06893 [Drepanopeziza brunnea f. sp. 'multigermtubi' MB_m1]